MAGPGSGDGPPPRLPPTPVSGQPGQQHLIQVTPHTAQPGQQHLLQVPPHPAQPGTMHTQLISLLLSCFFTDNMTVWTSWLYICTILLFIWRIPPPSIFLLFQYWIVQIFAYPIIAKYVKLISPRVFSFWASENTPALRLLYLQRWALGQFFRAFALIQNGSAIVQNPEMSRNVQYCRKRFRHSGRKYHPPPMVWPLGSRWGRGIEGRGSGGYHPPVSQPIIHHILEVGGKPACRSSQWKSEKRDSEKAFYFFVK